MIVSALKQTSPERITVIFDTGDETKTTLSAVTELRLFVGRELDAVEYEEFTQLSARALGREKALEYISRRRMSRKELINKLKEKGEDQAVAEYCAEWLESRGFIDDASYSCAVVRHYAAKGYGVGRIKQELSRRGISKDFWDDSLKELSAYEGKLDKLIASKLKDSSDKEQIRKLSASLYRRGYSWEDIRSALDRFEVNIEEEI